MPAFDRYYTYDHEVRPDGSVAYRCSTDLDEWPWLALPPQHPIPLQSQNFWASVGATGALQTRADDKWSALTWTRWELGDRAAGMAARGSYKRHEVDEELRFGLEFFDAEDRLIAAMEGKGVIFRNRNFEKWRDGSKEFAEKKRAEIQDFAYAPRELLSLTQHELPLVATLENGSDGASTTALITHENGLPPAHKYFTGSGDHVNSTHLAEVARQTAGLLSDGKALHITNGEMDMHRYVELGTPFEVQVAEQTDNSASLHIRQLGKSCAKIMVEFAEIVP